MTNVVSLTNDNFLDFITKNKICLVDFYADWCQPCKELVPILNELSEEYIDKAYLAKVNPETANDIFKKYKVMGLPTLIIYVDGEMVKRQSGNLSKEDISKLLESYV